MAATVLANHDDVGRDGLRRVVALGAAVAALLVSLGVARPSTAGGQDVPRLAFVDGRELRVVRADGQDERTLTHVGSPLLGPVAWSAVLSPTWSPDGRRVAYVRGRGAASASSTELHVVDADGRNDSVRLSLPWSGTVDELHWSPAGDRLAFTLRTVTPAAYATWGLAGQRWDLFTVEVDGSDLRPVAPLHPVAAHSIDWSPDGSSLTFISDEGGLPGVYRASVDGPPLSSRLTPPDLIAAEPRWSPDGRSIAFRGRRVLDPDSALRGDDQLWTVRSDGRGLQSLPARTWEPPSWSPDSRWMAYACGTATCGINIISSDGRRGRTLTRPTDRWSDHRPLWSRQGTIAFTRHDGHRCCPRQLWVVDDDGTDARRLTSAEAVELWMAWSR